MQSIFGTDGIRGRFNKEITYSLAYKVGYALGANLENNNNFFRVFIKKLFNILRLHYEFLITLNILNKLNK